ncbi:MAG: RecX family transcriptional regulator [Candidatus Peribacteria bacterium]|nr:MAG: RecX family transcriptional regulator [Candidatus Peribacteria bacterium]
MSYTKERLRDYALWYYFRYFPSNAKLKQQLQKKSEDTEVVEDVFQEIEHLLQEEQVIDAVIRRYLERGKNLYYIRTKLLQKLFPQVLIGVTLEKYMEEGKSIVSEHHFRKKIESYLDRGKSRQYILQKLIERREDRAIVEELLLELYPRDMEDEIITSYIEGYTTDRLPREKMIQKLLQKGFYYEDIKRNL